MESSNVFLGTLTHNDHLHAKMARAFFLNPSQRHNIIYKVQPGSLLAASYNQLWCDALNMRSKQNLKWFSILHADIAAEAFWLDKLIEQAELFGADVMSAIVPIKESSGATSTAVSDGTDNRFMRTRLTMTQVHSTFMPKTFDVVALREAMTKIPADKSFEVRPGAHLLVNTGCFVCRIDKPWARGIEFTINDRIIEFGNQSISHVEPEDWYFSRKAAELGAHVMATSGVVVDHMGSIAYNSDKVWGNYKDPAV